MNYRQMAIEQTELLRIYRKDFDEINLKFGILRIIKLLDEIKFQRKADFKNKNVQIVNIKMDIQKIFDKIENFKEAFKSKNKETSQILYIHLFLIL